jgi:tetratricopeptide (TPR) repeat protein
MKKYIVMFSFCTCFAAAYAQTRIAKPVKIGPEEYYLPPPVDTALLRKQAIQKAFLNKPAADDSIRILLENKELLNILSATEIIGTTSDISSTYLTQLLADYTATNDIKGQTLVLNTQALAAARSNDLYQSVAYYMQSLALSEKIRDRNAIVQTALNLGALNRYRKNYAEAIRNYEYAAQTATALRKMVESAHAYIDIAHLHATLGNYKLAEYNILKKALLTFQRARYRSGRMISFENLGLMYYNSKQYSQAKWFFLQSKLTATTLGDKKGLSAALHSLSKVKFKLGDYTQALEDARAALDISDKNADTISILLIQSTISDIYYRTGKLYAAESAYKEYKQMKEELFIKAE